MPLERRFVAGWTGLEPATSSVTGRCSNQLNYQPTPAIFLSGFYLLLAADFRVRLRRSRLIRSICSLRSFFQRLRFFLRMPITVDDSRQSERIVPEIPACVKNKSASPSNPAGARKSPACGWSAGRVSCSHSDVATRARGY